MPASTNERNADGLTFEEWLLQADGPEGFREWHGSWQHWRLSHSVGWAVSCYLSSKSWHRREFRRCRRLRKPKKAVAPG
jgi:hypothetical protein